MTNPEGDLQANAHAAREALDAHVREIVAWHFDPETGCPFWLDWAAGSDWDPRQEIQGFDDLSKFGLFEDERVLGGFGATIGALTYDEADIGYWLAADAQGRGLATECSRRLIDWLLDERDMHRITIRARTDNTRSRAVAERLGFTFEGVLREALLVQEAHHDAALYSLLRSEWPREQTANS